MTCCLYPHPIGDGLVAPAPHPQSGLDPALRCAFHPGAEEVDGGAAVIAHGLVERSQGRPDIRLHATVARGSEVKWQTDRSFAKALKWLYLLCGGIGSVVPHGAFSTPSRSRGTEVLDLAEVGQDGAGATVHPVKGIAGVCLPVGLQKLPAKLTFCFKN